MGQRVFFQWRCRGSIDAILEHLSFLKAHDHAATIPALAFFFLFSVLFAVEESFWSFVFDDGVSSSIETS